MRRALRDGSTVAWMVIAWATVAGAVAAVAIAWLINPLANPTTIQCDGIVPTWMTEVQDYGGGGCITVLPTDKAPEGADWTPYCLGLC